MIDWLAFGIWIGGAADALIDNRKRGNSWWLSVVNAITWPMVIGEAIYRAATDRIKKGAAGE